MSTLFIITNWTFFIISIQLSALSLIIKDIRVELVSQRVNLVLNLVGFLILFFKRKVWLAHFISSLISSLIFLVIYCIISLIKVILLHLELLLKIIFLLMFFLFFDFLFFIFSLRCSPWSFKLKLTVSNFSALLISCSCYYLCTAKHKSHFNSFVFYRLKWTSYINTELSKLFDTLVIYKIDILMLRAVEYYTHNSLSCSNRTVCLYMYFIYTYRLALRYECIEYIFTEVFTFNYNFLFICVPMRVEGC